ncbi:MAG: iron-containing alcohol dehydrogenase [Planctomycetota bacterium]|nr:iron-containing alcohol dehydrogenase [Planctomycetota bacterium]
MSSEFETYQNVGEEWSPIHLGRGSLHTLPDILKEHDFDRLFVITDGVVHRIHGKKLEGVLSGFEHHTVTFPSGESSKALHTFEKLAEELLDKGITMRSLLLASGGGVAGNIGGFLAATLFRGIPFGHIPTTFQAQTDSTLSRKQALNCNGKNLIGCFYSPLFTLSDTDFLSTEPRRSLLAGIAESIKNAIISDEPFYHYLDEHLSPDVVDDAEKLHDLVQRSILTKLAILRHDPSEKKDAIILEYGHTVAHALETVAPDRFTHGECVGIGMVFNARLAVRLGLLKKEDETAAENLLMRLDLPVRLPEDIPADLLLEAMRRDNKRRGEGIEFVLLEKTCRPHYSPTGYCRPVSDEKILACLEECRS